MSDKFSFYRKFLEGETKSGFWNVAWRGVSLVSSFAIIYFLSVYEYGLYQLILAVLMLGESLTAGFVDDVIAVDLGRYLAQKNYTAAKKLFFEYSAGKLLIAAVIIIAIFFGANYIAGYYGENIALLLRITALALIFRIIQSVFSSFFKGAAYFKAYGAPVAGEAIKIIALVVLWFFGGVGIKQALIAYLIGHLFTAAFLFWHFYKLYRKYFTGITEKQPSLLWPIIKSYGWWMTLRYIMAKISNNIRPWLIKFFISTEAVALFALAKNLVAAIMSFMPLGTFQILLPRELHDPAKVRYLFVRMLKYSIWFGLAIMTVSLIVVPPLVSLVFPKYIPALPIFRMMAIVIWLYAFYKVFRMTLTAHKEFKILAIRAFDNSIIAPLLLAAFLPVLGVIGAAYEYVITYAITAVLFYHYLIKYHPYLRIKLKNLIILDNYDRELFRRFLNSGINFIKSKIKI